MLCLGAVLVPLARLAGPPLSYVLGYPVIGPGGIIVMLIFGALDSFGIQACPMEAREADACPAMFAASALIVSFLFWWVVAFVIVTVWHKRRRRSRTFQPKLPPSA